MYEKLCSSVGEERLKMIADLKLYEIDLICKRVKRCAECSLGLHFVDPHKVPRVCCLDISTPTKVRKILSEGGYFVATKGI